MITFAPYPVPVIIKQTNEEAYVLYVESGGLLENDILTIVKCNGGAIIHVTTQQVLIHKNATFEIKKQP